MISDFTNFFADYTPLQRVQIPEGFFNTSDAEENIDFNPVANSFVEQVPSTQTVQIEPAKKETPKVKKTPTRRQIKQPTKFSNLKGTELFEKAFAEAAKIDPTIKPRKSFFVRTMNRESGGNSKIQNQFGAPCYGWFQMQASNIKNLAGMSVDQYLNDPVAQILTANKLYNENVTWLKNTKLYDIGIKKGYNEEALVTGCWLGNGATKKYLLGQGDPSDKHWSKDGKTGVSVSELMNGWMNGKWQNLS